ncbi:MAG: flagellin lysine-N-methylase [Oscillospiraceae bacterium]|nr:flagellin lysine-N-methylase [Oscillospiraceae bacterium]
MANGQLTLAYFRQPKFYSNFSCMGGECPDNCCKSWRIDWSKESVEKLRNSDCSEKLRNLIDTSFEPYGDGYIIKFATNKYCPFLDEEKFCGIQRELGESYLSPVCTTYPRAGYVCGNALLRTCYLSCYKVIDTICDNEDAMMLENYFPKGKNNGTAKIDDANEYKKHPELNYRSELFEFFYEIISDSSRSVETSVVLGALAAQKLTEYINAGKHDCIPEVIKALRPQINNTAQIAKLEQVKPNYSLKIGFITQLHDLVIRSDLFDYIYENGSANVEKYIAGEKIFNEIFSDRPFAMRNIALNLLIEMGMPFRDKNLNLFDNYSYFVAVIAAIKLSAPAIMHKVENSEQKMKVVFSYIGRSFAHNDENTMKVLDVLKEFHCTSPAYLAAIIK